ncbi:TatD family hydrolase [Bacillaceae bacterium S4-13-58]
MKIIDSHIHLDLYKMGDIDEIKNDLKTKGDRAVTVSFHLESCRKNLEVAEQGVIYPAFGFHPEQPLPTQNEIEALLKWMEQNQDQMVAVGEVGLPYYRKQEHGVTASEYEQYVNLLEKFIMFAKEWEKPIILHAVYDDAPVVVELLEKYGVKKAQFHWFKGAETTIKRMIKNGYMISVTPDVCYEKEIQELVKTYPLELMMVETDGPWPFEGPFKGHNTHPKMIHESVKQIAFLKNITVEKVYKQMRKNTENFFQITE